MILCHINSCQILSSQILSSQIISCQISPCQIWPSDTLLSNLLLPDLLMSDPLQSNPVLSDPLLSDPLQSNPLLSYPLMSYPLLSDPILSYPLLSVSLQVGVFSDNHHHTSKDHHDVDDLGEIYFFWVSWWQLNKIIALPTTTKVQRVWTITNLPSVLMMMTWYRGTQYNAARCSESLDTTLEVQGSLDNDDRPGGLMTTLPGAQNP